MRICILGLAAVALTGGLAHADSFLIRPDGSGDYPTIQEAIDAAADADTVVLAPGVFTGDMNRDVSFRGKAIVVRSQAGDPDYCIIDCEGSSSDHHRAFLFTSGEGPRSVLEGMTITRGFIGEPANPDSGGAGVLIETASPILRNCHFVQNEASGGGGAIRIRGGGPQLVDCECGNNYARYGGALYAVGNGTAIIGCRFSYNHANVGGALCLGGTFDVRACEFEGNSGEMSGALSINGHGLFTDCHFFRNRTDWNATVHAGQSPEFLRCSFVDNLSLNFASVLLFNTEGAVHLRECTLTDNEVSNGGVFDAMGPGTIYLDRTLVALNDGPAARCFMGAVIPTCCDIFGNTGGDFVNCLEPYAGVNGNISEDPLFCDAAAGDFRLAEDSPCAPFSPPNPECDLIGAWPVGCSSMGIEASHQGLSSFLLPRSCERRFCQY